MAGEGDAEDRTHAATPKRRQRAREQGQVPLSREAPALAGLLAATLVLAFVAPAAVREEVGQLSRFLAQAHRWDSPGDDRAALVAAALSAARLAAPFVLAILVVGVGSVLLQTGGMVNLGALRPNLARINPLAGLRRLAGADNLVEAGKSLGKVAALGAAAWFVLSGDLRGLATASVSAAPLIPAETTRLIRHVLFAVLGVQAAIAAADLAWVRIRHARSLRMSREEVREEHKESEGDPRIKGKLKQVRMQRARKRMLAAVPKATVVITNPTHYAVALVYDRTAGAAPRVVAKGVDSMAARIREIAAQHRVPLVANPPLARALHRVDLDAEIPAEHYQAVAEIIAYVWRLGQRDRVAPG